MEVYYKIVRFHVKTMTSPPTLVSSTSSTRPLVTGARYVECCLDNSPGQLPRWKWGV
ncbi:hypothetical protein IF2G_04430 [Cordyceps javanica]|nr:hypothetical protein IF2G_04430 [Cordyceps javanica]